MALEVVPAELMTPESLPELVEWLQGLPFDPEDIKQLLVAWHKEMGVPLTVSTVDQVLGRERGG